MASDTTSSNVRLLLKNLSFAAHKQEERELAKQKIETQVEKVKTAVVEEVEKDTLIAEVEKLVAHVMMVLEKEGLILDAQHEENALIRKLREKVEELESKLQTQDEQKKGVEALQSQVKDLRSKLHRALLQQKLQKK